MARTDGFPFEIGHTVLDGGTVYTISATQPLSSKLTGQKICLTVLEKKGLDTTTRYFTLATGKHQTVAQLDNFLADIFRRFSAVPPSTANQALGKIGSLQYGGEVHFVAETANDLRFDNLAPNETVRASHYTRDDALAFTAIIGH